MIACKIDLLEIISKLPENVDIEELMYRLYVLEKVKKGIKR